jgi:hypothetical protein
MLTACLCWQGQAESGLRGESHYLVCKHLVIRMYLNRSKTSFIVNITNITQIERTRTLIGRLPPSRLAQNRDQTQDLSILLSATCPPPGGERRLLGDCSDSTSDCLCPFIYER